MELGLDDQATDGAQKEKEEEKNPPASAAGICMQLCMQTQGTPAFFHPFVALIFLGFPLWGRTAANSGLWLVLFAMATGVSHLCLPLSSSRFSPASHTPRQPSPPPLFCMSPFFQPIRQSHMAHIDYGLFGCRPER